MDLPSWLLVIIRSAILVIVLFLLMKWLGKKQLSHVSFFEYIVGITIGSIAAEMSTGLEANFAHGMFSLLVWTAIPFIAGLISLKSKKARALIEGTSTIVIQEGKIQEDNLTKEKYTVDELMQLLRGKNAFRVADVEFAVLEADGELNVLLKKENQPLTPKDMHLDVAPEKVPQMVIQEGKIMDKALAFSGHTRIWLQKELEKLNVALDNVYIGQVDSYGVLSVDIYDDKINIPTASPRKQLLNSLRKCQADMEAYALQTDAKDAKAMYLANADILTHIINKSQHLLVHE